MKLPQLTLRDLFWLVLVCALAVGWWVDRLWLAERLAVYQEAFPLKLKKLPAGSSWATAQDLRLLDLEAQVKDLEEEVSRLKGR